MADADDSLRDLVAVSQERIKTLRRAGDLAALLAGAKGVADEIEHRVGKRRDEAAREALTAARRFTFNAAADCWPGWAVSDKSPDMQILLAARELARRSAALTQELDLGPLQEGTGIWLVGAFDLALGRHDDAVKAFDAARERYTEGKAPGLVLLTEGYMAIVWRVAGKAGGEELGEIVAKIKKGGFEDGEEWVQQLNAAMRAFGSGRD
jgi:hypothetical protein